MSGEPAQRGFWWEAGRPAHAATEPLGAVLLDLDDTAVDDATAPSGLDDLVNSLYFAAIPIAVVSRGARGRVEPLVRQLVGDGIADTVVTPDDLERPGREPDLHGHALWELGLGPESALAFTSTRRGLHAARAAKVATLVVTSAPATDYVGAVEVRAGYDGLLVADCERLHRRWWARR